MKKNYFTGFIGALIGSVLFTIPWILVYVYGGIMLSILGFVIGYGGYLFYKLFRGKIAKPTVWIIVFTSLVAISVSTFVFIPILLLMKQGYGVDAFKTIYANSDFIAGILRDYFISVIFTLLGIGAVIKNIKIDVSKETGEELIDVLKLSFEDKVKYVESVYAKYDAFSKEKSISEFKIMKDMHITNKLKFIMEMEKEGVIVCPFIKSYMNRQALTDAEGAKKLGKKIIAKTIIIGVLIAIFVAVPVGIGVGYLVGNLSDSPKTENKVDSVKTKTYTYKNISIELPNTFLKTPGENWEKETSISYNRLSGRVTQVLLQEEDINKEISQNYSYLISVLIENLKNDFNIHKEGLFKLNEIDSYKAVINSKEYPEEYYYLYFIKNNNKLECIWMLTRKTEKTTDNEMNLAEIEADGFAKTIKLTPAN